ncbi:MAG: glycosyl hydrolase 115 family protein [Opitutaceae bacterium]|nr:glycosyl hydrolase 115 family protein [Opitutaceae bacterium]
MDIAFFGVRAALAFMYCPIRYIIRLAVLVGLVGSCTSFAVDQAAAATAESDLRMVPAGDDRDFALVAPAGPAVLCLDGEDFPVVRIALEALADDICEVTDVRPEVRTSAEMPQAPCRVIAGTIGRSRLIDGFVARGELDVAAIRGGWERFVLAIVDEPMAGVGKTLVIAGSDRRGTAYGVFRVSEAIGVSPWAWWADVPVRKHATLSLRTPGYVSPAPAVKYRGIFINDEDWGLKPWAAQNYEKELGDIGPKTYARVCELLLRLKGNMMAPAMHSCTGAFYSHADSKVVADRYGIIITTSHCEPLLFNNAAKSEWDNARDGEWTYATNGETIRGKLDARVREAAAFENLYTVGMRGLHDEGMRGHMSDADKVRVLEQVIADERAILQKRLQRAPEEIPQIFVPYKEALDLYNLGLRVPDDVTLVWTDDNYGYIKRLSDAAERGRSGGAGVYYHLSYLGAPHDYLWLCTTPPVLMYAELKKAYDHGADRYWLLNVGDIKPAELAMQTFFDLAWSFPDFDYDRIHHHQSRLLASFFGPQHEAEFQDILATYYRLAWSRKPEFMGWEREWDAPGLGELADTAFSFEHYNDAQQRLADYERIAAATRRLEQELPEQDRPAFFELLGYPVQAAGQMNRKFLLAQLNRAKARAGELAAANWAADEAEAAFAEINRLTERYNAALDGKWRGMMALAPGWVAKYQNMPSVVRTPEVAAAPIDLAPTPERGRLHGCTVLALENFTEKVAVGGHTLRIIDGLGYDGRVLQLGQAGESTVDPADSGGSRVSYPFSGVAGETVTVHVTTVPFFPLHPGQGMRFGLSVDGGSPVVATNERTEFSRAWKDQVLQNGAEFVAQFTVDPSAAEHTLTLTCGDPGVMVQRIVIDWGGLRESYVGPSAPR